MTILLVLAAGAFLLLLPFGLVLFALPASRECPLCHGETVVLRTAFTRILRRWLVARWCMRCGWEGLARTPRRPARPWSVGVIRADPEGEEPGTPYDR
jgi:predicted RNA-binding Zn-ribbon protein involved in translation (DUF1610 family)